ncbi:MAG TPA: hypothetical protein VGB85_14320 [Nannocystis sp.]
MTNDKVIGLNIRRDPNGKSPRLGLLPRGAKIAIGARSPDGKWGQIKQVISGTIAPVQQGGVVAPTAATGWVFLGELDPGPAEPTTFDDVVVPPKPVPIRAGDLIGYLGEYQQHVDALPTPVRGRRPMLHLEILTGESVPAFVNKCRAYARTLPAGSGSLFVIDKGAKLVVQTNPSGEIAGTDQAVPVGDATGAWVKVRRATKTIAEKATLGAYNSANHTYASGAVWTGWYVGPTNNLRTQSDAAAKKAGYTRREVMVPVGPPVWVEKAALDARGATATPLKTWNAFPLHLANAKDPAVGLTRVMTRTELERTPQAQRATDPEGNHWWRVSARTAAIDDKGHTAVVGWACEKGHDKVSWQSPWAWPGFEYVEEGAIETVDMWSTALLRTGMAKETEFTDFTARADKVDKSALLQKLYELIDTNKNGIFEPNELHAAMQQPLLSQALARVVTRYESEWGGDDSKWVALDPLVLDGIPEWQAEKQRIKSLRWWPKVAGKVQGFPASPVAYHIHPIGLIANFHGEPAAAPAESAPAARRTANGPPEKSGRHWVSRFMSSSSISDLKQPFQGNVAKFFAALKAGGVSYNINTTLRPPQRSYLMYYAREVASGRLAPDKVPPFVPQENDEPVNIDWAHKDSAGKPDLVAAKKAARDMDSAYGAAGAIGKPYRSNHNGGRAIDVRFTPAWGIGKSVVDANGKTVKIGSKRDILNIGGTYNVFHWNYHGAKAKEDDPHWSATGN